MIRLEQERKELLAEQRDLATKMAEVRARVAEQQQQKA
jgi:hypothetical protein